MTEITSTRLWDSFRLARASRYSAPENGADALPIVYGDLTTPTRTASGVYTCPKIDTAGSGTYCVAGHAISGSVSLFDDDGAIGGGDFAINTANDFQSQGVITTAIFSVAPTGRVTAVCAGKLDATPALIENPVEIIEDLLINGWGLVGVDINNQAFSRAKSACDNLLYAAAGVITGDHKPIDIIQEILESFFGSVWVDGQKKVSVKIHGTETISSNISPVAFVPTGFEAVREMSIDGVINTVPAFYAWNSAKSESILHDDGSATADAASVVLFGTRLHPRNPLTLKWVRQEASVQTMQGLVVSRYKKATDFARLSTKNSRLARVDQGDYIYYTIPWALDEDLAVRANQIGEVVSISYDLREQTISLAIRETDYFFTTAEIADGEYDDGTSLLADGSILAGGSRDAGVYA